MTLKVALVILAAGKSTRFPGNKLLAKIKGESIIEKIVKTGLRSKVDMIIVVTGYEADKIRKEVEKLGNDRIKIVYNPDYEEGQSTSVKLGVREVIGKVEAVMIHPADVALINPEDINRLIEVFQITSAPIVVASHGGRRGHPILFSNKIHEEIMMIREEKRGLKEIVEKYREDTVEVESSRFTIIDIDTPEDLKKVLENLQ
ncbi:MAG: nucleotidyltransferase family protein [Nitrososphaerota archaeon]|nr:nucleotidyltransferase family protein [Nitrososphaerota archaeon]